MDRVLRRRTILQSLGQEPHLALISCNDVIDLKFELARSKFSLVTKITITTPKWMGGD